MSKLAHAMIPRALTKRLWGTETRGAIPTLPGLSPITGNSESRKQSESETLHAPVRSAGVSIASATESVE
ncbi:hypothetical protein CHELA17_61044 [Chelatococcus asaccharovorans]|nr:hypothetical protein CHELA17_61044 [Chelatococcus asaccharovorans]